MRLLARIEHVLGLVVEGTVDRLFRAPLHPVHLMRALETAMEEGVLVEGEHALVPNLYRVRLDRQSHARFAGARGRLERDCEQHLLETAPRRRFRFLQSPVVELELDPALRERSYAIDAAFSPADTPPSGGARAADPEPTVAMPSVLAAGWMLEIHSSERAREFLPLTSDRYLLGRDEDNDIQLPDSVVSRHHAELRRANDDFEVRDLGSTNGLLVNGVMVASAILGDGDELQIGSTQLVMRRR